ncbi:serine/threonine-protein kinase [Tahibacter amnicola]|uniref:Serine/threonine protein kinase n=1 Tax=Tahibacter amnicola TaxID=2976241 RepID=A0ABY6B895_9GAMM|nr:serine/threonine-protein kinase [Tahibacter amnicola]UXI66306.1 serine/threonine protein kinase [Tahibacter amnicola]
MPTDISFLVPGGALAGPLFASLMSEARHRHRLEPGTVVDKYRVVDEIGCGGSSVVYRAERCDGIYQQTVALKVIGASAAANVLGERDHLALLSHHAIARLFDAGALPSGDVWLAIEYIEGQPLDAWAQSTQAAWRARLEMLLIICDAVQYAHSRLIVHRDIKPANILVDANAMPRILDFGIAARLDQVEANSPVAFTPSYASPEQIRGELATTATDIFQLGRLLQKLTHLPAVDAGPPTQRLPRLLERNLAAVADKATAPRADARYASVTEFAADLRRALKGHPVQARPWSLRRRLEYFVARHWLPLGAGVGVAALLAVIAAVSAHRVALERDFAWREARSSYETSRFFVELFSEAARQTTGPAKDVLAEAPARAERHAATRPVVMSGLLHSLGAAYVQAGRFADARGALEKAVALRREGGPESRLLLAQSLAQLAYVLHFDGEFARTRALANEAAALVDEGGQPQDHVRALNTLNLLLVTLGRYAEASRYTEQAVALSRALSGLEGTEHLDALRNRAHLSMSLSYVDAAQKQLHDIVDRMEAIFGADAPNTLDERIQLHSAYAMRGDLQPAGQFFASLLSGDRPLSGDAAYHRHSAQYHLAMVKHYQGRWAESAGLYDAALKALLTLENGTGGPHWAADSINVAGAHADRGDVAKATRHLRDALASAERSLPEGVALAINRYALGHHLLSLGPDPEGAHLLQRGCTVILASFVAGSLRASQCHAALAQMLLHQGRHAEAAAELDAAERLVDHGARLDQARVLADVALLRASLAKSLGHEPRTLQSSYETARDRLTSAYGSAHPLVADVEVLLAEHLATTDPASASRHLAHALPVMLQAHAESSARRRAAVALAAELGVAVPDDVASHR